MRISIFLFLFVTITQGRAQKAETPYLLDSFVLGIIYYKTGENREASLNFHRVSQEVVIDFEGQRVPLSDFSKMDSVDIAGHVFVYAEGRPMEILMQEPLMLYIDHKCTSRLEPNAGAYGVKSHSTKVITETREGPGKYYWKLDDGYEIRDKTECWIERNDQWSKFTNVKKLGQLFPAKKKILKDYANAQKVDFTNASHVLNIVAVALEK